MTAPALVVIGETSSARTSGRFRVDVDGFKLAADLHSKLSALRGADVVVDFSRISWFDGHLTAALDAIFRLAGRNGNVVRLTGLKPRLRDTFCKNRLIYERKPDRFNTVMPITAFAASEGCAFSVYAKRHLDRREMPRMTSSLRGRFFEGIDELFANAALHARATLPIMVGGQYFPRARRLAFCIADSGVGMHRAVCTRLEMRLCAAEAIAWAMEPFNTTRQGDIPGGLGSKVLREFIEINNGRMTVVSNDGYWEQHGTRVSVKRLALGYPGTAVVLEIDTSDRHSYHLAAAPAADSIW